MYKEVVLFGGKVGEVVVVVVSASINWKNVSNYKTLT
jgi:hypothetical protein